jgi:hypothetical protein
LRPHAHQKPIKKGAASEMPDGASCDHYHFISAAAPNLNPKSWTPTFGVQFVTRPIADRAADRTTG